MGHGDWYAVRTIFKFGQKKDGKNIFEERIVCFRAHTFEEALDKAGHEARQYASDCNLTEIGDQPEAYMQDGDDLIDSYELWSELYETYLPLTEFYADKYSKYAYLPE